MNWRYCVALAARISPSELATARDGYRTAAVEDKEADTEEGSQGHAKLLHIHKSWSRN